MISEIKISMFRQWLNEDRITDSKKMITNADIKYWLGLISSIEYHKEIKKEKSDLNKFRQKIARSLITLNKIK